MQGAGRGSNVGGDRLKRSRCDVCGRRPSWWVSFVFCPRGIASPDLDGVVLCDDCVIDGAPSGCAVVPYTPEAS